MKILQAVTYLTVMQKEKGVYPFTGRPMEMRVSKPEMWLRSARKNTGMKTTVEPAHKNG